MSRLGLDKVAEELDLSGFEPKRKVAPAPVQVAAPPAVTPRQGRVPRTYRTGRSETIAVKTTPDAASTFCALADRLNLKVGETFERAVQALAREANRAQ